MTKVSEIIKFIWNNKRYRSLAILFMYFIFFGTIILISEVAKNNNPRSEEESIEEDVKVEETIEIKSSYNFKVEINNNFFNGYFTKDKITFVYNNVNYIYENTILTPSNFKYEEIIKYIDISYVNDLIKDKEKYSKTEYYDGSISNKYQIEDKEIEIYERDNSIYEIDIKINNKLYKIIYE